MNRYWIYLFSLWIASAPMVSADHFFEDEKITQTQLHPGVVWKAIHGRKWNAPFELHVVSVDLRNPDISLQVLPGARQLNRKSGQFVARSTISQYLRDHGALVAMNVPFFQIASTQTPSGLLMIDGMLLREPSPYYPSFLYSKTKGASIDQPTWDASVKIHQQKRPLAGVNRPSLQGDEVVLYAKPWSYSPGNNAEFIKGQKTYELLVKRNSLKLANAPEESTRLTGKVLALREGLPSVAIEDDQFVLVATESASPFFRKAKIGDIVEVTWKLTESPIWPEVQSVVAGSPMLISDGQPQQGDGNFWKNRHPRSALGLNRKGTTLFLVLVDGRSKASAGMNLYELTEYFQHLGAWDALNVDGGGSSVIGAKVDGAYQILNTPSDGRERYVPAALGVLVDD